MRNPIFPYPIIAIVGANVLKGGSGGGGGGGVAPTVSNTSLGTGSGANSAAVAMASNVTSGNVLVLAVTCFDGDAGWAGLAVGQMAKSAGTATIGTITLDATAARADGSNANDAGIYSVPITGSGSLTMTWTSGGSAGQTWVNITAVEVANMDTSGTRVNATATTNTGSGTSFSSGSVATGGAGIIFGAMTPGSPYGSITITEDGAFSLIGEVQNDTPTNYSFIYQSVTTNTTNNPTWSLGTSSSPVGVSVAYKSSTP